MEKNDGGYPLTHMNYENKVHMIDPIGDGLTYGGFLHNNPTSNHTS